MFDKKFIRNPSNCECEFDKSCDIGEYLEYENCKYRKKLVHELVEECTEIADEKKMTKITLAEYEIEYKCSWTISGLLFLIFAINIGIGTYFI